MFLEIKMIYEHHYLLAKPDNQESASVYLVPREMEYFETLQFKLRDASLMEVRGSEHKCDFEEGIKSRKIAADQHPHECYWHSVKYLLPKETSVEIRPDLYELVWTHVTVRSTSKRAFKNLEKILAESAVIVWDGEGRMDKAMGKHLDSYKDHDWRKAYYSS